MVEELSVPSFMPVEACALICMLGAGSKTAARGACLKLPRVNRSETKDLRKKKNFTRRWSSLYCVCL